MLRFGEAEAKAKALASSQDHAPTSPTTEEEQDDDAEAAARKLQQEQEEEAQKAYEQQKKQDQDGDDPVKYLPTVVRLPSASGKGWVWSGEAARDAVAQILAWREEVLGLGGTAGPSGPGVTAGPSGPWLSGLAELAAWPQGATAKQGLEEVQCGVQNKSSEPARRV